MAVKSILFADGLDVGFAVWIEQLFAAFLPGLFHFGRRDVPVRPAFFGNGAQILAKRPRVAFGFRESGCE